VVKAEIIKALKNIPESSNEGGAQSTFFGCLLGISLRLREIIGLLLFEFHSRGLKSFPVQ